MSPKRVFISHTDRSETDQKATTAIAVELRRVGIDVWLDRENPPPEATPEQQNAGPVPENPLFNHIVSALKQCDAVIYVASPASFDREYVRIEFDPRVLYQEYSAMHPDTPADQLPFYLALVAPLKDPPPYWSALITSTFPGRVLNLTGAGQTPLILPTALMTMIRDIAPECLFPLDPTVEWAARTIVEKEATTAPNCPEGVDAPIWLRFEGLFGLGPLFPGSFSRLSDDMLRYGMYRIGDTARIAQQAPPMVLSLLSLWTANIMLRSNSLRLNNGADLAVEHILPNLIKDASEQQDVELIMALFLQYGYGLLTSPTGVNTEKACKVISQCKEWWSAYKAAPLVTLAELLYSRASGEPLTADAKQAIEDFGLDPFDTDLRHLHHSILDACFPGPRLEAIDAYRIAAISFQNKMIRASSELKAEFAKQGREKTNP